MHKIVLLQMVPHNNSVLDEEVEQLRRSTRSDKGIPPLRYGVNYHFLKKQNEMF